MTAIFVAIIFACMAVGCPNTVMSLYSKDFKTIEAASIYLRIYGFGFIPIAIASVLSVYLRCVEKARIPLYASIIAVVINVFLDYVLILGKLGFPAIGIAGAAWASTISMIAECLLIGVYFLKQQRDKYMRIPFILTKEKKEVIQYASILFPILICEFMWSLGDNVYVGIYGHIGTEALAAMTLTNAVQGLVIGALSGTAQAAGIIVGKNVGAGRKVEAFSDSRRIMLTGLVGSLLLSVIVILLSDWYVQIYPVEESVRILSKQILIVYAFISPFKVQNMILGGGILRSGGKTKYVMWIDLIGTWGFGVPVGLAAAFVFHLSIAPVYAILSLEECIRFGISWIVFQKRTWMQTLE